MNLIAADSLQFDKSKYTGIAVTQLVITIITAGSIVLELLGNTVYFQMSMKKFL